MILFGKFQGRGTGVDRHGARMPAHVVSVGIPGLSKIAKLCPMRPPKWTADPWVRVCATKRQPSNEPTPRRALRPRCAARLINAKRTCACKQWRSQPLGPEHHGGQVCRYAASLIQGKPGKGEGLGDPGVLFGRVSRICPCSRPWSTRRSGEAEGQRAVFFGRASPIGPRKRKPDSAPFPSCRRQPNQMSTRLVQRDMFLSSRRHVVNGRAGFCRTCKGPGMPVRCRISGAGKGIAR